MITVWCSVKVIMELVNKRITLIFCHFLVIFAILNYLAETNLPQGRHLRNKHFSQNVTTTETMIDRSGYLIDTPGCIVQYIDPWDPSIMDYILEPNLVNCNSEDKPILTWVLDDIVYFDHDQATKSYPGLQCCYKTITRFTEDTKRNKPSNQADGRYSFSEICFPLMNHTRMKDEFIEVNCTSNNKTVYTNFHAFVPKKNVVEERCQQFQDVSNNTTKKPSILMIGIDSVSRPNFIRQMPETYRYLSEAMGSFDLQGYIKIADNTLPNVAAFTTGFTLDDLSFCWSGLNDPFDPCPWIWKNFSQHGYRTIYAEDAVRISTFNYDTLGFVQQPTDYYFRPFIQSSEENIGWRSDYSANLCQGSSLTLEMMINYTRQVLRTFSNDPFFALIWTNSLSHDDLNYPRLGDVLWKNFLQEMEENGYFQDVFLFFMSDHGMRWGDIVETYQGKQEERLPFVFIRPPKWFIDLYPTAMKNLKKNQHRLTTPFDLYETLTDLLNTRVLFTVSDNKTQLSEKTSLFSSISPFRQCQHARIDDHWCVCVSSIPMELNDQRILSALNASLQEINSLLSSKKNCSHLTSSSILDARRLQHTAPFYTTSRNDSEIYQIVFTTIPGSAHFESTVRHHLDEDQFSVVGSISRINRYGNQSHCIEESRLKKYCYCTVLLENGYR